MAKQFEERKFNIPKLNGISEKAIEVHLGLYTGYVKNVNELLASGEYNRRFPFEFDGMRNHEVYFSHFEGGSTPLTTSSPLAQVDWEKFKTLALTRGVGWAMLGYDKNTDQLIQYWVSEHEQGQLVGLSPILALDMWEHAYFIDYAPAEKKKYIGAFFENLNWQNVEENYASATQK